MHTEHFPKSSNVRADGIGTGAMSVVVAIVMIVIVIKMEMEGKWKCGIQKIGQGSRTSRGPCTHVQSEHQETSSTLYSPQTSEDNPPQNNGILYFQLPTLLRYLLYSMLGNIASLWSYSTPEPPSPPDLHKSIHQHNWTIEVVPFYPISRPTNFETLRELNVVH